MGRFISEDPIQDGVNWYMFAGNDPVNFADPSGLAMQGYPLAGGYSGNVTTAPTISSGNIAANNLGGGPALSPATNSFLQGAVHQALNPTNFPSTTFGGFVNPAAGNSILGLGPLSTPTVVSRPPTAVEQFHYTLSASSNLSALTRTVDPLTSLVQQQRATDAYRADQALSALRGANEFGLVENAQLQAIRDSDTMGMVYRNSKAAGQGELQSYYNAVGAGMATMTGVRGVSDAFSRHDAVDGHRQSTGERIFDGVTGTMQLAGTAAPIASVLRTPRPTIAISNPTVTWVDEAASMSDKARLYNSGAQGARSNVSTRQPQAPSIPRTTNGRVGSVRFDGEAPGLLIDRKLAVVTSPKAQNQALRQAEALRQNGLHGMWEVPNATQAARARSMFSKLGIDNIDVRVVQ